MQKFQDVVLDSQGRPVPGAVIELQEYPGGLPVTVYQTNDTGTAYFPVTDSLGGFFFYAPNGRYSYTVTVAGVLRKTVTDILLQDYLQEPPPAGIINAFGIKFPADFFASQDVNTLDDYEEGSWSPTILSGNNSSGRTYSKQTGRYRKIGSLVNINGEVTILAMGSSTGNTSIGGLPFGAAVDSKACAIWYTNLTFSGNVTAELTQQTIFVFNATSGMAATLIPDTGLTVGTTFVISCSYNNSF